MVDALAKLTAPARVGNWVDHLAAVSWVDRITVKRTMGMTPFRVVFGQECLLLVDLAPETWMVMERETIQTATNPRAELLALHAR